MAGPGGGAHLHPAATAATPGIGRCRRARWCRARQCGRHSAVLLHGAAPVHTPSPIPRRRRVCNSRGSFHRCRASMAAANSSYGEQDYGNFVKVVLPTSLALMLCNMDRICLSVAIIAISKELAWPSTLQGIIQSAFLYGYMATQLLGGTLADKYGGKIVFGVGILWFSLASALFPVALSEPVKALGLALPAVLFARFCVGFGEGVALPSMNNLVATYIPRAAKARALGLAFTGFHCGNLLGLIVSPLIVVHFGWRALFYVFGLLGVPMMLYWLFVMPTPLKPITASSGVPKTNHESGGSIVNPVSLLTMLSKPATWAIITANVSNHWGYFIYLNWMPTYFNQVLGFDMRSSSFVSLLPWLIMSIGTSVAGVVADGLVARGTGVTLVRKGIQTAAFVVPAAALMLLSNPNISSVQAVTCMSIALGVSSLGQAGFVANMSDIAPRHAGQMFGLCNTFGSFAGILGVTAVGFILDRTHSFQLIFRLTASFYVFATIIFNCFATGDKVFD